MALTGPIMVRYLHVCSQELTTTTHTGNMTTATSTAGFTVELKPTGWLASDPNPFSVLLARPASYKIKYKDSQRDLSIVSSC